MQHEIKLRTSTANKGYYALEKKFKLKLFSRWSKKRMYLSFLRLVLSYAYETWSATNIKKMKGTEEEQIEKSNWSIKNLV